MTRPSSRARGLPKKVFKGYISSYVRSLEPGKVYRTLSPLKKLALRLFGYVRVEVVFVETPDGIKSEVPVYLARCSRCGRLYVDYPHGYKRYIVCPNCGAGVYV